MYQHFFKDRVTGLIDKLIKISSELKGMFDNEEELNRLSLKLEVFNELLKELEAEIDRDILDDTNLMRHVAFLNRYISEGNPESCYADIKDILEKDLPRLRVLHFSETRLDKPDIELEKAIKSLLFAGELDSAVRKSFLVLSHRLRKEFGVSTEIDGIELVNYIFGNKGVSTLPSKEKEAVRNLLAGMYGVFRNDFMHNLVNKKETEFATILMINTILKLMYNLDSKS